MNTQKAELENTWKGSEKTFQLVYQQIAERYGENEAEKYNPDTNCFTASDWNKQGKKIIKGEKALKSFTYIAGKETDKKTGEEREYSYMKKVNVFYYLQVEEMSEKFKQFLAAKNARIKARKNGSKKTNRFKNVA